MRGVCVRALLAVVMGCSARSGQLVVVVDSDLQAPGELGTVRILVTNDNGHDEQAEQSVLSEASFPLLLTLVPARPGSAVRIDAVGLEGTRLVVEQVVRTNFPSDDRDRVVPIRLDRACLSSSCTGESTCRDGSCVDPSTPLGSLPFWSDDYRRRGDGAIALVDGGPLADAGQDSCVEQPWYADCDGDGYARLGASEQQSCGMPAPVGACGWTTLSPMAQADCDDTSSAAHPGITTDLCDNLDNDCDSSIDEDAGNVYLDHDGDHYGSHSDSGMVACPVPSGYAITNDDCNDDIASINPGASEICDMVDEDCDLIVDEDAGSTYYIDLDGDNYGDPRTTRQSCGARPVGYAVDPTDCDDGNHDVHPAQSNYFDIARPGGSFDYDCDGVPEREYRSSGRPCDSWFDTNECTFVIESCTSATPLWCGIGPEDPPCGSPGMLFGACSTDMFAMTCAAIFSASTVRCH